MLNCYMDRTKLFDDFMHIRIFRSVRAVFFVFLKNVFGNNKLSKLKNS